MSLSGGYLIGNAQGMITISNAVGNFIYSLSMVTPGVGSMIGAYIQDVVTATLSANYGTYWVFGVLLACFGLMLVYWGTRSPGRRKRRSRCSQSPSKWERATRSTHPFGD